jgi:hypothetical protein
VIIWNERLALQFICTRCRLRTFYLAIEEPSNWTILSMTDYNCSVDQATLSRRAAGLFTACTNRATLTAYRSNTQHHFWLLYAMYTERAWFECSELMSKRFLIERSNKRWVRIFSIEIITSRWSDRKFIIHTKSIYLMTMNDWQTYYCDHLVESA